MYSLNLKETAMTELAQQHARTGRHTQDSEKNSRVPSLRLHKASGRAYVVLSGKAVYCGRYGEPEAAPQSHERHPGRNGPWPSLNSSLNRSAAVTTACPSMPAALAVIRQVPGFRAVSRPSGVMSASLQLQEISSVIGLPNPFSTWAVN